LLTLLPFEPDWFIKDGLATQHVGHPVAESGLDRGDGAAFRARHGIDPAAPVLLVLPGSRHTETKRLLPVFGRTMALLAERVPGLVVVLPTVETVAREVSEAAAGWPVPTIVVADGGEKADAFAAGTAALAASGTVSLELALAGVATVVGYKVSPLSAFIATRFLGLRLKYASLINIVADAPVIPELLQGECRPERLAETVGRLLADPDGRRRQTDAASAALADLAPAGEAPSLRAARAVMTAIARHHQETCP
jgi:lipid-A-disaccharide synthase